MTTVSNLLSKSLFKDFRLFSGAGGLNNQVTCAGFFEWEQDFQITKSFNEGEFVITTLALLKDDSAAIEKSIKLLINNRVSAIAIKDVYFSTLPDTIKEYSDSHNVPIMFFTDTYIDELLYAIKTETLNSLYTSFNEIVLDTLISNDKLSNLEKENLINKINPFFLSSSMMCAYISNEEDTSTISPEAMVLYNSIIADSAINLPSQIGSADFVHSFIAYKRGIFLLITSNTTDNSVFEIYKSKLVTELKNNDIFKNTYIGLSNTIQGFNGIKEMLLDAIFSNTSGLLDNKRITSIDEASFDQIVYKNCYLLGMNFYYEQVLDKLAETSTQRAPLLETLLTLISCNGNVDTAAQHMYQHKNTIRYRISKLKSILAAENDMEFYGKMYFFSRIHFSKKYLNIFFK